MKTNKPKNSKFITSFARGLSILEAFDPSHPVKSIADLSRGTGLSGSTVYRMLYTLRSLGYVIPSEKEKGYSLGPKVLSLGYSVLSSLELKEIAEPYLTALHNKVSESVNLAVLDEWQLVFIERMKSSHVLNINFQVGTRLELYNNAAGQVLGAYQDSEWFIRYVIKYLEQLKEAKPYWENNGEKLQKIFCEIRSKNFAVEDEEFMPGLRAIAAPVRNNSGRVIGAITVAVHSCMYSIDRLKRQFLRLLMKTAENISKASGY
ncbi:IclR family transcriptional regulator [Acidobacteriota bacterium]